MSKTYGAILIDPPWGFRTYSRAHTTPHRCSADPYATMTHADLLALPVASQAAKDCALFMWTVDSHLNVAMELFSAWGFTYKTIAFAWVKLTKDLSRPAMGMGYWSRKQAEICLLATRGHPRRKSKGVPQVLMEPRREHSRKPDGFYSRIEALVDGPFLEMFARQRWPGWDSWGNEIEKFQTRKEVL